MDDIVYLVGAIVIFGLIFAGLGECDNSASFKTNETVNQRMITNASVFNDDEFLNLLSKYSIRS